MAETVTMPKLGFDMAEGTLLRWVKVEGDKVNKGDILAEIETDKATVEVESDFPGVVVKELVREGDIVPVGTAIAIIAKPGEKVDLAANPDPEMETRQEETAQKPSDDRLPPTKGGDKPAKEGDPVDAIALAESVRIEESTEGDGRIKASPLARKLADEKGIDLHQVKGTGQDGRIVRSDVEAAFQTRQQSMSIASAPAPQQADDVTAAAPTSAAVPALAPIWSPRIQQGTFDVQHDQSIKVNRRRAAIGRRMTASKQQTPHFYITRAYKMEKLMDLRKQINIYLPDDQKLTVNDFVIKAVALALRQFPNLNATIKGDEITRYGHVNIGVAVSIEGGLLTITVKDADQKPLRLISMEVREMAARVRAGKARTEDLEGSTFSISNLGMYDVDEFIAIINPPEAAILAIGSAKQVPVVEDGQVKAAVRMNATISADHRVTDGAESARFMQALATYLEDPMRLVF